MCEKCVKSVTAYIILKDDGPFIRFVVERKDGKTSVVETELDTAKYVLSFEEEELIEGHGELVGSC